ncbi:MAG: amidohydrolase [Alistipes sp.]|nr:amidohydrolase [Alistipes sp.]
MKQRVTILQRNIAWCDISANLDAIEQELQGVQSDVVVLSEMFQTGFVTAPESVADDGRTLEWMKHMAKALDAAIVGSIIVKEGARYYNRAYFVKPSGDVTHYDKRHLFTMGGEQERFSAGSRRTVVEWRGVRYLLEICYDLRFPVWSRQRGDYDAIIYSALWPAPRREVWRTLLRARAIENQCYVIGVNRVGDEPALHYAGDSAVVDSYGRAIVELEGADMATVELDMEALNTFRTKFNVGADADTFTMEI